MMRAATAVSPLRAVSTPVACYLVSGPDDPELAPRIFGQFARRGLVPAFAMVRRASGQLRIRIEAEGLDDRAAELLAEGLRALLLVETVELAVDPG